MHRTNPIRAIAGLSLVELMVAMVIALLGVLVIFQVFAVNEEIRRGTTASGDEQTSGLLALMLLQREVRHAGFGINDFDLLGCNMKTYDSLRTPAKQPDFTLAPVQIITNAGTTPDLIRVIYGGATQTGGGRTEPISPVSVKLANDPDDTLSPFQLIYRFGFAAGDVLVVGQPGTDCTLVEVTATPGLIDIQHALTSYVNTATGTSQQPRFNDPAGTPVLYRYPLARVMNLGPFPVRNEITVVNNSADPSANNQLTVQNIWGQVPVPIAIGEQVVQLKAEYGMDDGTNNNTVLRTSYIADDNVVDNYTGTSPTTAAGWSRVRSVRLAIVTRSNVALKPNAGTSCDATLDYTDPLYPVVWARGPDAPTGRKIDVRTTANWRCFKYKVYETTVPLRNMLWRQA